MKSLHGQVSMEWIARYNDSNNLNYFERAMVTDESGNVYVTGYKQVPGNSGDYATLKYNSSGVLLWSAFYDGPAQAFEDPKSIAIDNQKNVYVTGYSTGNGNNYATVKYNSEGVEQWVARFTGPQFKDFANVVKVDKNRNVYVTGYGLRADSDYDYLTIKYDQLGNQQWIRTYNGTGNGFDRATAMAIDDSGNVIVTGYSNGIGTLNRSDFATLKYSPDGDLKWVERYNSLSDFRAIANAVVVDRYGNVYVTGEADSIYQDFATIKYNNNGVLQWAARYNGPEQNNDVPYSIALDSSGNVLVAGTSYYNFTTVKYNTDGTELWVDRYKGLDSTYDEAYALATDKFDNVYVTGYTSGGPGAYADYTTIKYDPNGNMNWVEIYNSGGADDIAHSIGLDTSGNVYISGSVDNNNIHKFATIKYSQLTRINTISSQVLNEYRLLQNYPNPFNPVTEINFTIPVESKINLVVYDINGKEISILVNGLQNAGNYSVAWDASNFASGIYFYKLIGFNSNNGVNYSETKKMLLVK